jgi:hypothetical protein
MRAWLVALWILLTVTHARADEARDAATRLLAEQVRALNAGDAKAFAKTFSKEAFLILPTANGEARGRSNIAPVVARWLAQTGKLAIHVRDVHVADFLGCAWFDAQLVGGENHWRISGVVAREMFDDAPYEEGPKVVAVHVSEAVEDKRVLEAALAGQLPALPVVESEEVVDYDDPSKIAMLVGRVERSAGPTLIGSAPDEYAIGHKHVTKLLRRWKKLKLETLGVQHGYESSIWGSGWTVGHVQATYKVGGKVVKVPYRVLMLVAAPSPDAGPHPVFLSAHFSVAMK